MYEELIPTRVIGFSSRDAIHPLARARKSDVFARDFSRKVGIHYARINAFPLGSSIVEEFVSRCVHRFTSLYGEDVYLEEINY